MTSALAIFLRQRKLADDIRRARAALQAASLPKHMYLIVENSSGDSTPARDYAKELGVSETRIFTPPQLSSIDDGPANATQLRDYLRDVLWKRIVSHVAARVEVLWNDDWMALALAVASLTSFMAPVAWWAPTGGAQPPDLRMPRDALMSDLFQRPHSDDSIDGLVGRSKKMEGLRAMLRRRARLPYPVLLIGETGTGKELCARALHDYSDRVHARFVPVNAALLGSDLAESTLFGHVEGAFTGATRAKQGRIREAAGGTFFLDEIDSLPLPMQGKLLRALNRVNDAQINVEPVGADLKILEVKPKASRRVANTPPDGGGGAISVPVRLVSAMHENPFHSDAYRQDLYFRISTILIEIPPLRDREDDAIELAKFFLNGHNDKAQSPIVLHRSAHDVLRSYRWPGNVRELERVMLLAWLDADENRREEIKSDDIQKYLIKERPRFDGAGTLEDQVARYRVAAAEYAFARNPENATAAARELGMSSGQDLKRMLGRERSKARRPK